MSHLKLCEAYRSLKERFYEDARPVNNSPQSIFWIINTNRIIDGKPQQIILEMLQNTGNNSDKDSFRLNNQKIDGGFVWNGNTLVLTNYILTFSFVFENRNCTQHATGRIGDKTHCKQDIVGGKLMFGTAVQGYTDYNFTNTPITSVFFPRIYFKNPFRRKPNFDVSTENVCIENVGIFINGVLIMLVNRGQMLEINYEFNMFAPFPGSTLTFKYLDNGYTQNTGRIATEYFYSKDYIYGDKVGLYYNQEYSINNLQFGKNYILTVLNNTPNQTEYAKIEITDQS